MRVCPESKELVPMVLVNNIGLRTAIATWLGDVVRAAATLALGALARGRAAVKRV